MSGLGKVSGMDEHITGWQLAQLLVLVVRVRYQHYKYMLMNKRSRCCYAAVSHPWHFGVDPDPDSDPAIFVFDLQDANIQRKSPKEVTKQ
jgi:hypothetical protein